MSASFQDIKYIVTNDIIDTGIDLSSSSRSKDILDPDENTCWKGKENLLYNDTGLTLHKTYIKGFAYNNSTSNTFEGIEIRAKKTADLIVRVVSSDEFIEGEVSKTELLFEKIYKEDAHVFREAFQRAWLELYTLSSVHLYTFISTCSGIDYSWMGNKADALILAGYSHKDELVNEAVIRAVEHWGQKKHIEYLENMRDTGIGWLESYKKSTIDYLRSI